MDNGGETMKALISLVLICGLWGQTASAPDTIWADCGVCTDSTIYNTISRWDWNKEYFPVVFLYLYEQYETECYNDSSQVVTHIGYTFRDPCYGTSIGWGKITCTNLSHYNKTIWIHKEPTFHGFMKHLKRR